MTNPNDLIRRGDAVAALSPMLRDMVSRSHACGIINALPAAPVSPEVLALVETAKDMRHAFIPFTDDEFRAVYALDAAIAAWEARK